MISRGLAVVFGALLNMVLSGYGLSQEVGGKFVLDLPEQKVGEELIARNNSPLVSQHASPERAVKLLSSATTRGKKIWTSGKEIFPEGSIFYVASADGRVFCPIAHDSYTRCLMDSDGSGRFDTGVNATSVGGVAELLIYHEDGGVIAERMTDEIYPLPERVPYAQVPPEQAPKRDIKIFWRKPIIGGGTGESATIQLFMRFGDSWRDALVTRETPIIFDRNSPKVIRYGEATLQILGFTPEGLLRYRIERPMSQGPKRFSVW